MAQITMKELLEAGVHFGHQTKRWNPKMAKYIFGERNGIYIIDLQKTLKKFRDAYAFVRDLAANGGTILFVGTKKQAQETIADEAARCGMFYVNQRWLGGTLTNFTTIRKSINRLKRLEDMRETGEFERVHQEGGGRARARARRSSRSRSSGSSRWTAALGGLHHRSRGRRRIAVAEAQKLQIPIIAIVDTNCDPERDRLPDPGQRRRHPGDPADHLPDRRRGRRGARRVGQGERRGRGRRGGCDGRGGRGRRGRRGGGRGAADQRRLEGAAADRSAGRAGVPVGRHGLRASPREVSAGTIRTG